jgi:hypothetical protein
MSSAAPIAVGAAHTAMGVREIELEDLSVVDALTREAGWGGFTRDG